MGQLLSSNKSRRGAINIVHPPPGSGVAISPKLRYSVGAAFVPTRRFVEKRSNLVICVIGHLLSPAVMALREISLKSVCTGKDTAKSGLNQIIHR